MKKTNSLDYQTFNRLSKIYSFALGAIAIFTCVGQLVIQQYINHQINDSNIINLSGRQRMLSQKLTKELLLLTNSDDKISQNQYASRLKSTISLWKLSHNHLLKYNDSLYNIHKGTDSIQKMFQNLQPNFEKIYVNSINALNSVKNETYSIDSLQKYTDIVIKHEPLFLRQMDAIVNRYEKNAQQKLIRLKRSEYILFGLIILILIFELLLLFRPAALRIKKTISDLLISQQKATDMANRAEELRKIQNESVQELITLTKVIDQTLFYARVDQNGKIRNLGNQFKKLLSVDATDTQQNIIELMPLSAVQKNRLHQLISQDNGGVFHEEFDMTIASGEKKWMDISVLNAFSDQGKPERLLLGTDISKRKEAQIEVENLRATKYRKKEELQKANASQIVEAQEEERKRIAKEIHDSIGQMLTALKFNIESINFKQPEKAAQKIEGLKKLSKDLIQGIRIATFNLTPPELKDYGIGTALEKMTRELAKMTSKNITIDNKMDSNVRFDTLVETNLYRVTQEAVSNAIKYAEADYIMVTIKKTADLLSIVIDDNGKGFEVDKIPEKPKNNAEGGMGIFFMRERMNYINGRLFLSSEIGNGTRITLNYIIPD